MQIQQFAADNEQMVSAQVQPSNNAPVEVNMAEANAAPFQQHPAAIQLILPANLSGAVTGTTPVDAQQIQMTSAPGERACLCLPRCQCQQTYVLK